MITRRTVLVLGAGASMPFGFPSGRGLWEHIVRELALPKGDFFRALAARWNPKLLEEFRRELLQARPPSVDVFLDDRREYLEVGKAAIAAGLIPFEQLSLERMFAIDTFSWYDYLYHRLTDCKPERFHENQLSIVTFNYDRSLEYFFHRVLMSRWGLKTAPGCAAMLGAVPIIHVYGRLGTLDEFGGCAPLPYGLEVDASRMQQAVGNMQILHEAALNSETVTQARKALHEAEMICFLGFGYHPTNLERLGVTEVPQNIQMLGTAYGLLPGDAQPVVSAFGGRSIQLGNHDEDVLRFLRSRTILI